MTPGFSEKMKNHAVIYSHNALWGSGGQGEFLRLMAASLKKISGAHIFSRGIPGDSPAKTDIPFVRFPEKFLFDVFRSVPGMNRRQDVMTLLSDREFDRCVAERTGGARLFDGIIGQCHDTQRRLRALSPGCRLVVTSLNTHPNYLMRTLEEEHRMQKAPHKSFLHPEALRQSLREIEQADFIRVNSRWAKETFVNEGVPASKISVIHPGVDRNHFRPLPPHEGVFRVLVISTIDVRKGIYYLLKAFTEADIPDSELVLIGGTGDRWSRNMLRDFMNQNPRIRQKVVEVTQVPAEETYGQASVVVHSSLEDGYGLVIPQALACGRPVIATRQSGASELIQDGVHGFTFERRDTGTLRDRLRMLASDKNLRESMARRAPEAVSGLDYPGFAAELIKFYTFCTDSQNNRGPSC